MTLYQHPEMEAEMMDEERVMPTIFKPQTQARANLIADNLNNKPKMLGLDFGSLNGIVGRLLPILIACFNPDDGQQAQEYVSKRWTATNADNIYCGYDKRLVKSVARSAKQAARQEGQIITWRQAYEIALSTLDDIRVGDANQASIAIAENHDFMSV